MKKDFDKEALSWDLNPGRVQLAADIATAIQKEIRITQDMKVMDYGCGTGLLTLSLQPLVEEITGVDTSQGMLDVLRVKIQKQGISNIRTLLLSPDSNDLQGAGYQLIVNSMTLHHVVDPERLIREFFTRLSQGGYLAIADLDCDDGEFHDDSTGVFHNGFDRAHLRTILEQSGFEEVRDITAAEIGKTVRNAEMRLFSIFLMIARK
jgi:ubiquinone/menaquinone biosynthesis C-methylase UbiE